MKIAIAGVRGFPARYGGFETSAEETARRMHALGHEVTVYCRNAESEAREDQFEGIRRVFRPVPGPKVLETILHSIVVAYDVIFSARDVDVVHMYNAASVFGGIILRLFGKPLIMTIDGVEWKRDKWGTGAQMVWKAATWLSMRVPNVVVCDSQTVRKYLEDRYHRETGYVPYGSRLIQTTSDAYRSFNLKRGEYLLFVGRLVPEKGADVLIDAYNNLDTEYPLVIVGDNEHDPEYVKGLRARAGKNVRFLGYRYGEQYESLLVNAFAYVTASKLEGTSPSLLAAMGARTCCLVRGIPENRETGGDAVLYFDGSAEDLTAKLRLLIDNPQMTDDYREKGCERVELLYDWDAVTRRYLSLYCEIAPTLVLDRIQN